MSSVENISPSKMVLALRNLKSSLSKIIEASSNIKLDTAIAQLQTYPNQLRRGTPSNEAWGYTIDPFQFKQVNCRGYNFQIDIRCDMRWRYDSPLPVKQDLALRVWSVDKHIMFREKVDSMHILNAMENKDSPLRKRVVLRCHFDRANDGQVGPAYHLQFGGKSEDEEYCWFPKEIDLPRLAHQPLDLILLCQIVVANFYPSVYTRLSKDSSWRTSVLLLEESILEGYYNSCLQAVKNKKTTLLEQLWNIRSS